jgi:hypothetical protein
LEEPHQSAKPRNTKPRNRGISLYPSPTNHSVAHIIKTLKYIIFFHSVFLYVFFSNFIFVLKMFLPCVVRPLYSVEQRFPEGRNVT